MTRATTAISINLEGGRETVARHYAPANPRGVLFVFAHGAGAGQVHPFMTGAAEQFADHGIDAVTFDFPYMHARKSAPDKAPVLEQCFHAVIAAARRHASLKSHRLFIGGKSMGGRMATHLGAQSVESLRGIVVFGYPLHPPGAPQKLRVSHLPDITVPLLIVQGERDAFGTPAELAPHLRTMKAPFTLHPVPSADHSLTVRSKKGPEVFAAMLTVASDWMLSL